MTTTTKFNRAQRAANKAIAQMAANEIDWQSAKIKVDALYDAGSCAEEWEIASEVHRVFVAARDAAQDARIDAGRAQASALRQSARVELYSRGSYYAEIAGRARN